MPLKIIDRYILRQFITVFAICFISLTGLYIVIDAFANLDSFIAATEQEGGLLPTMARFYLFRSIGFFDLTSGMLAMVAANFTVTWLQRHNEMTALMAAGVSRGRVALPVICAGAAIASLSAAGRETVLPCIQRELSQNPKDLNGEFAQLLQPRYDNKTDVLIRGQATYANEQRIDDPDFLLPENLSKHGRQIVADDAYYQPASEGHPAGYLLRGVTHPEGLAHKASLRGDDAEPVILVPGDTPWLKPDECFVASEVDFEQLTGGDGWRKYSSTATLIRGLSNESLDFGADVRVAIHARIVKPLMDINLLLLGLPLVMSRGNRNVFVAVGLCMLVVCVFMLTTLGSHYLGTAIYISPHLAAWLPLIIFVPVAVWMSKPLQS